MRKLLSWLIGFSLGAALAALLVMIFFPETGEEVRRRIRQGYEETMAAAQVASLKRRAELEARLATLQGRETIHSSRLPSK
ncbi:MAG: hypothetical protein MUF87_12190 [Anaerolineae bacterium]|jgi:gas vesicle protein|nr:hypothetical protein [Anaerolineae bacterium]